MYHYGLATLSSLLSLAIVVGRAFQCSFRSLRPALASVSSTVVSFDFSFVSITSGSSSAYSASTGCRLDASSASTASFKRTTYFIRKGVGSFFFGLMPHLHVDAFVESSMQHCTVDIQPSLSLSQLTPHLSKRQ